MKNICVTMTTCVLLLAACGSTAMAGTILVNPTAGDITGAVTVNSTAASAKMKFSSTNWDMSISPRTSTDNANGATFLNRNITNSGGDLASQWNFLLSFATGQGYTFTMSRVGAPPLSGTLTWRNDAVQNIAGGTANSLNTSTGNGVNAVRSFNFIRLQARNTAGGLLSFSNIQFNGDATGFLAGTAGTVIPGTSRASIDGSSASGFYYQDILSDTDLSLQSWTLSGSIQSTTVTNSESVRFEMDMFNANGFTIVTVPTPMAALTGLAGIGLVGIRRRRGF